MNGHHPPDLTSSTSWQLEEEEEKDKEGFQGWELCPMYPPQAQRGLTRAELQHMEHCPPLPALGALPAFSPGPWLTATSREIRHTEALNIL